MAILCDPRSKKFREFLMGEGAQGVNSYEWLDEPLYRGDPIAGRLTQWERAAVDKMHAWIKANS